MDSIAKYLTGKDVSATVASSYTNQATVNDFITNAVFGEIGIVKVEDDSIYNGTGAIPANTEISFIKRGFNSIIRSPSFIHKGTPLSGGGVTNKSYSVITKSVGSAGVKPVLKVTIKYGEGFDCDDSTLGMADSNKLYGIGLVRENYGAGNVEGTDYTYTSSGNENILSVINKIIAKMTNPFSDENSRNSDFIPTVSTVTTTGALPAATISTFNITSPLLRPLSLTIEGFCWATIDTVTEFKDAVNDFQYVKAIEKKGIIKSGRFFTEFSTTPIEELTQDEFVVDRLPSSTLYTGYQIRLMNTEKAQVAGESIKFNNYDSLVFVPKSQSIETKFNTMFGL